MTATTIAPNTKSTTTPPPTSTTITYAPYVKPVTGDRLLPCVSLKWEDNAGTPLASVKGSCEKTAENFKRLSNGQFNFTPSSYSIAVPYKHATQNVSAAVDYAKKVLEEKGIKKGNTSYVMVNNNAQSGSHTGVGGDTSNLLDALTTTFYHEVGRQNPTDLGSAGAFKDGKYQPQGDGSSFMSRFSSNDLPASVLYELGWLPNTQVALYDSTKPTTQDFTIDQLNTSDTVNLKAILITGENKPLFFSKPTMKAGTFLALHLADGGNQRGSERITVFGKGPEIYDNLSFEEVSTNGTLSTVRISPYTKPEPAPHTTPETKTTPRPKL